MSNSHDTISDRTGHSSRDEFTETSWTQVVSAARQDRSRVAREALEALCARYWPSIYSFLRRKGHAQADAEDLAQGFFAQLLGANALARADRSKGRFRSFLLGALERFLADQVRRKRAQKRGGGQVILPLDFHGVEEAYLQEVDPRLTPEEAFDRRWAATVLETAFGHLHSEFQEAGQLARFKLLKRFLTEQAGDGDYEELALRLHITPQAVSSAVCRLRERFREFVKRDVLATVAGPEEVDKEFLELFR
jgi:RNA polymerase sigma factor (sigma-70 family)